MAIRPPLPCVGTRVLGGAFTLLMLSGALAGGCARAASTGGQPAAEAPSSALDEDQKSAPETLEQAEAELEQARLALAQLGGVPSPPPAAAAAAGPATRSPAESMSERSEKTRAAADEAAPPQPVVQSAPKRSAPANRAEEAKEADAAPAKSDDNPCLTTCKAYASLLRAKNAVCRLDVPNGARCTRAEGIVRDATPQVQSCQCSP